MSDALELEKYFEGHKTLIGQKVDAIRDFLKVQEYDYAEVVLAELEAVVKDIRRAVKLHKEGEL